MSLKLSIENLDRLPDGGPMSVVMGSQSRIEIGRHSHLDWCLPDPQLFISGKHCEITRQGDDYLLHDVSTNGTFVNGSAARVQSPYRLKDGDRLQIGEYLVAVALTREGRAAQQPEAPAPISVDLSAPSESLWDAPGGIAPPADPREFKPKAKISPVYSDFLYHAADVPRVAEAAQFSPNAGDWGDVGAPQQEAAPRAPQPRRQKIVDLDWGADPAPSPPPLPGAPAPSPADDWSGGAEPPPLPPQRAAPPAAAERPRPAPAAAPVAAPAIMSGGGGGDRAFLQNLAVAAGLPDNFFDGRDSAEVAGHLGSALKIVAEEVRQLLQARVHAKRLVRSADHTVIEARENNPLKFSPTTEDALRTMLGKRTASYLGLEDALTQGFSDLKRHQVQTYAAMQQAVSQMMADLDPARIERAAPAPNGLAALVKSRKVELWDAYLAAWEAQARDKGGGDVVERFMTLFGAYYDGANDRRR